MPAEPRADIPGFVALVALPPIAVLFLLWALLPDWALEAIGWEWYPSREWALLLPAWSMVLVWTTYAVYLALNLIETPNPGAEGTFVPPRSAQAGGRMRIPHPDQVVMWDIPQDVVEKVLYGKRKGEG